MSNLALSLFLFIAISLAGSPIQADEDVLDAATRSHLSRLLTAALTYDLYNNDCRGFLSSMHADNVETLTVEKFAMTLTQLSQALASKPLSALTSDIDEALLNQIRLMGGCKAAKSKGYLDKLDRDFQQLYDWLSDYP